MKSIKDIQIIFRKELAGYFNSAIAYIFLAVFTLLNGGLFMTQFFLMGRLDMRPFFLTLPFILCVFLPAVSMRLWAEERRGNTFELLLTFPAGPGSLVLGKFLAGLAFYLLALLSTLPVPIMLLCLGRPDLGAVLGGYLGAAFLGAFFLALGALVSGFCRDQIVAFIVTLIAAFAVYLAGADFIAATLDGWAAGFGTFLRQYAGAADRYAAFPKGVADARDILYFLTGTTLCLVLNGFWIEGRGRPKASRVFTTAAALCACIFVFSNWFFSSLPLGRFDMTEGRVYSVSPASKDILRQLKAPVLAKFYVSSPEHMPTAMKTLERDVRDKLDELRLASQGRFQYRVFHTDVSNIAERASGRADATGVSKKETLEEQISQKGIEPFQVESIQSDELGVKLVYSSISLSYREKPDQLLPRIYPGHLDTLEYEILSKVYRMTLPEVPKVALAAPYADRSIDPNLQALLEQLGAGSQIPQSYRDDPYETVEMALKFEGYPVSRIDLSKTDAIPERTRTLVVLEPRELTERQRYEINRFLCEGGSLFLAVQNYEFNYRPGRDGIELVPADKKPGVNGLLGAWGFGVDGRVLADAHSEAISLTGGPSALFGASLPVKLPVQILLSSAQMNPKVSITSRLSAMFYLWGSALTVDEKKVAAQGLKADTLLSSSPDSWTVPFNPALMTTSDLAPGPGEARGPFPLAVLARGTFNDAFEGKPAPPAEGEKKSGKAEPPLKRSEGKLVLIGAATPFQRHLVQGGGHLNFFMNSIDVLTLGGELVGIRSKSSTDRTLPKVPAAAKVFWRFFVTLFAPMLIGGAGVAHFYFRNWRRKRYLKTLE